MPAATASPIPPVLHRVDPRRSDSAELAWWLLHAPVGSERTVADRVANADCPVVLPLVEYRRRTTTGGTRRTTRAIFDGYVFLAGDQIDRLNALQAVAGRGCWTIPVYDTARLCRELAAILDAVASGLPIGLSRPLAVGDRVRVAGGVLQGHSGVYAREGKTGWLWLDVAMVGRSVPVLVEDWQVERIEDAGP